MAARPVSLAFRWRGTHVSHVGPRCPVCSDPLGTHYRVEPPTNRRSTVHAKVQIRNGTTSRTCFEVQG